MDDSVCSKNIDEQVTQSSISFVQNDCVASFLKEKTWTEADLIKIFRQSQEKNKNRFIVKYAIKDDNKVCCVLCNCIICQTTITHTELMSSIRFHTAIHLDNMLKEIKSLPECDNEMVELLQIKDKDIICRLCTLEIKVEDIKSTLANVYEHFSSKIHTQNVCRGIKKRRQNFDFYKLSEKLSVNRYYIFLNTDGRYFCQLCNCLINVNIKFMLNHIASEKHLKYLNDKSELILAENSEIKNWEETEYTFAGKDSTKTVKNDNSELKNHFEGCLPQIIEKNQCFIAKEGDYFKCIACDELLFVSLDSLCLKTLNEHFKSSSHKYLVNELSQVEINKNLLFESGELKSTDNTKEKHSPVERLKNFTEHGTNSNYFLEDSLADSATDLMYSEVRTSVDIQPKNMPSSDINEVYEELKTIIQDYLPRVIEKNQNFIIKSGKHYKCNLCDVLFFRRDTNLKSSLKFHFKSLNHTNYAREYFGLPPIEIKLQPIKRSSSSDISSLKQVFFPDLPPKTIIDQQEFIVKKGKHFRCTLCNTELNVMSDKNKTEIRFLTHLTSSKHKKRCISEMQKSVLTTTIN